MINLRNSVNGKEITEDENPNKIVDIDEKIYDFNKQQKGKILPLDFYCSQLKILTPKKNALEITKSSCTNKNR